MQDEVFYLDLSEEWYQPAFMGIRDYYYICMYIYMINILPQLLFMYACIQRFI